jgi:hypothetical protein
MRVGEQARCLAWDAQKGAVTATHACCCPCAGPGCSPWWQVHHHSKDTRAAVHGGHRNGFHPSCEGATQVYLHHLQRQQRRPTQQTRKEGCPGTAALPAGPQSAMQSAWAQRRTFRQLPSLCIAHSCCAISREVDTSPASWHSPSAAQIYPVNTQPAGLLRQPRTDSNVVCIESQKAGLC